MFPVISLYLIFLAIVGYLFLGFLTKETKIISKQISKNNFQFNNLIIQLIENFRYFKATNSLDLLKDKSFEKLFDLKEKKIKIGLLSSIIYSSVEPIAIIILSLIVFIALYINYELSSIILSLVFFYRIIRSILEYQKWWQNFNVNIGGLEEVLNNINFDPIIDKQNKLIEINYFKEFKINNLNFKLDEQNIFEDLNIAIKKNQLIGISGPSGSGKTTLINILLGLYEVPKSSFYINKYDSTSINFDNFRKLISFIPQNYVIFNDTIRNNLTLWSDKFSDTQLNSILDKINLNVNNLDLNIDDSGKNFSGGQLQRINFAREILKDKQILILDEPTSSLDNHNKSIFESIINDLKGKKTIILISHDYSLFHNCDNVFEIKQLKIFNK